MCNLMKTLTRCGEYPLIYFSDYSTIVSPPALGNGYFIGLILVIGRLCYHTPVMTVWHLSGWKTLLRG